MNRIKPSRNRKRLTAEARLGQRGVNLIESIVIDMGSRWIPGGPIEVGIDGYIELFDPGTGESLGRTLAVQSKAVSEFSSETNESFTYQCNARDIDYWTQGNIPVILVVSRPSAKEAYWVPIKNYFAGRMNQGSAVRFSKEHDIFSADSFRKLVDLSRTSDDGLYLAPLPRREVLYSNLLEIMEFPSKLYIAVTECRTPAQVWRRLPRSRSIGGDWIVRDKLILGFEDFSDTQWSEVCDIGSADCFDTSEWSESNDPERIRVFVQLLNRVLRRQLAPKVRFWPQEECYAFEGSLEEGDIRISYRSANRQSTITVVSKFEKTTARGDTVAWLRHLAFQGQFRRIDEKWYLEIIPTYQFTKDGIRLDFFHEEKLSGIKRIEGNRAVLSAVLFWSDYLSPHQKLFEHRTPTIIFGSPAKFEIEVGINDNQWSAQDPTPPPGKSIKSLEPFLPFIEVESFP